MPLMRPEDYPPVISGEANGPWVPRAHAFMAAH